MKMDQHNKLIDREQVFIGQKINASEFRNNGGYQIKNRRSGSVEELETQGGEIQFPKRSPIPA